MNVTRTIKALNRLSLALLLVGSLINLSQADKTGTSPPRNSNQLILATGDEQGVYFRVGQEVAAVLRAHGLNVVAIPSSGSVENLNLLAANKVQLCISQANIFKQRERIEGLGLLIPLHTETMHILIRKPLRIKHFRELGGKRISVGPLNGGTEPNAITMLEAGGISKPEVTIVHGTFTETVSAIQNGELDAAFIMMGDPAAVVEILAKSRSVSFLEPDPDVVEAVLNMNEGFVLASITAGTYTQQETIDTLGVPALLLAGSAIDNAQAEHIVRVIAEEWPGIAKRAEIMIDSQNLLTKIRRIDAPIHPGAKPYYDNARMALGERIRYFLYSVGIPLIIVLFMCVAYLKRDRLGHLYYEYPVLRVVISLVVLWFAGALVMYYAENKYNDNYGSLGLAFWSTFVNWISFGSKEPFTVVGRVNSTIMTIMGLGGVSWLASEVVAMILLKRGKESCKNMKDHFVIINWNEKSVDVIDNIQQLERESRLRSKVVIVSKPVSDYRKEFVFLDMNPLSPKIVEETNMSFAKSVIILSQEPGPDYLDSLKAKDTADSNNVLTVLNISNQLQDAVHPPHIVVEMHSREKGQLISGGKLKVEVVSTNSIESGLLVQVAVNPGLTSVYRTLLTNACSSSEIYSLELDYKWQGKTFQDIFSCCQDLRQVNVDILPLAISRAGEVFVNPSRGSDGYVVEDGDTLFGICDNLGVLKKLNDCKLLSNAKKMKA